MGYACRAGRESQLGEEHMIQSGHGNSRDAGNQSELTSTTDKTTEDQQSSVAINEEQTADGRGSLLHTGMWDDTSLTGQLS